MDKGFSSQTELYERVRPALRTKRHELIRAGFKYIKEEDIWNYNIDNNWRRAKGLTLASMVNDILNTSDNAYSEYVLKKINGRDDYDGR